MVSVALVLLESYAFLEKAEVVDRGTLVGSMLVAAVAGRPDWLAVLVGSVVPTVPDFEPWMLSGSGHCGPAAVGGD